MWILAPVARPACVPSRLDQEHKVSMPSAAEQRFGAKRQKQSWVAKVAVTSTVNRPTRGPLFPRRDVALFVSRESVMALNRATGPKFSSRWWKPGDTSSNLVQCRVGALRESEDPSRRRRSLEANGSGGKCAPCTLLSFVPRLGSN